MTIPHRTLGTLLRHMLDLLGQGVEGAYADAGLDYRSRYTPVLRNLMAIGPASIKALASQAGITHSAASQTVAQMARAGLVDVRRGDDLRQQVVSLTPKAIAMIPTLKRIWQVTNEAGHELDAELAFSIYQLLEDAILALEHKPFRDRRNAVAQRLDMEVEAS